MDTNIGAVCDALTKSYSFGQIITGRRHKAFSDAKKEIMKLYQADYDSSGQGSLPNMKGLFSSSVPDRVLYDTLDSFIEEKTDKAFSPYEKTSPVTEKETYSSTTSYHIRQLSSQQRLDRLQKTEAFIGLAEKLSQETRKISIFGKRTRADEYREMGSIIEYLEAHPHGGGPWVTESRTMMNPRH